MKLRTLLALVLGCACSPAAFAATRTVVLSGTPAPGVPAGANFSQLYQTSPIGPVLNNAGRVAFAASTTPVSAVAYNGVWTDASGALALVARSGAQAPDASVGTNFLTLNNPVVNDAGHVAFDSTLNVASATNAGYWTNDSGTLTLAARKGFAAPGAGAGVNFIALFHPPGFNDAGQIAFRGQLTGTGVTAENNVGIWAEKAGGLTLMARTGSAALGTPAGVVFDNFPAAPILINSAGRIAFRGFVEGAGVTDDNRIGIWAERAGGLELVARQGNAIPDLAGVSFGHLNDPSFNRNGHVAFTGLILGGPSTTNAAVFSDAGGSMGMIARRGSAAPGFGGATFSTFSDALLNGEGQIAFQAVLAGTGVTTANNASLWSTTSGALSLVAREGSQAAGAADGQIFSAFTTPALNAAGQLAFAATLTGTGISTANDRGIWAQGLDGGLRLVAQEGGSLEVAPGMTKTISEIHFTGGGNTEDGRRIGFNDYGEVAFLATFTDGTSGLFVSDVAKASAADFNGNGSFDGHDFLVWQRGVGRTGTGLPSNGDANSDGNVNGADLDVWKGKYGTAAATAAIAIVPEPSAMALVALALIGAMRRLR
jgi:hypothetical protein